LDRTQWQQQRPQSIGMRGNISRLVSTVAVNICGLYSFSHLVFLGAREFLLSLRAAGRHCAAIVEKVAILTEQH
jgi:hypothetical protein